MGKKNTTRVRMWTEPAGKWLPKYVGFSRPIAFCIIILIVILLLLAIFENGHAMGLSPTYQSAPGPNWLLIGAGVVAAVIGVSMTGSKNIPTSIMGYAIGFIGLFLIAIGFLQGIANQGMKPTTPLPYNTGLAGLKLEVAGIPDLRAVGAIVAVVLVILAGHWAYTWYNREDCYICTLQVKHGQRNKKYVKKGDILCYDCAGHICEVHAKTRDGNQICTTHP